MAGSPIETFRWSCPCCDGVTLVALTDAALSMKTATHIKEVHERGAALRAVDRARMECRSPVCELGRNRTYDLKSQTWGEKLTDFDYNFLRASRISWAGDERKLLPKGEET